jgi:hypothetical protein
MKAENFCNPKSHVGVLSSKLRTVDYVAKETRDL